MRCVDDTYETELNFLDQFELSRNGMVKEIKTEFDIVRYCLAEQNKSQEQYAPVFDRIIIMPIRKLLCEKNSVLIKICPNFLMPKLIGVESELSEGHKVILPPYKISSMQDWMPVKEWLEQSISSFNRTPETIGKMFPDFTYEYIKNKLDRKNRAKLDSFYQKEEVQFKGEKIIIYTKKDPDNSLINIEIFEMLDKIGYNSLNLYNFIKHMSDKRGAHIDVAHSILIETLNNRDGLGLTPVTYFAIQMIYAAKKQILELSDYWEDMPELMV